MAKKNDLNSEVAIEILWRFCHQIFTRFCILLNWTVHCYIVSPCKFVFICTTRVNSNKIEYKRTFEDRKLWNHFSYKTCRPNNYLTMSEVIPIKSWFSTKNGRKFNKSNRLICRLAVFRIWSILLFAFNTDWRLPGCSPPF